MVHMKTTLADRNEANQSSVAVKASGAHQEDYGKPEIDRYSEEREPMEATDNCPPQSIQDDETKSKTLKSSRFFKGRKKESSGESVSSKKSRLSVFSFGSKKTRSTGSKSSRQKVSAPQPNVTTDSVPVSEAMDKAPNEMDDVARETNEVREEPPPKCDEVSTTSKKSTVSKKTVTSKSDKGPNEHVPSHSKRSEPEVEVSKEKVKDILDDVPAPGGDTTNSSKKSSLSKKSASSKKSVTSKSVGDQANKSLSHGEQVLKNMMKSKGEMVEVVAPDENLLPDQNNSREKSAEISKDFRLDEAARAFTDSGIEFCTGLLTLWPPESGVVNNPQKLSGELTKEKVVAIISDESLSRLVPTQDKKPSNEVLKPLEREKEGDSTLSDFLNSFSWISKTEDEKVPEAFLAKRKAAKSTDDGGSRHSKKSLSKEPTTPTAPTEAVTAPTPPSEEATTPTPPTEPARAEPPAEGAAPTKEETKINDDIESNTSKNATESKKSTVSKAASVKDAFFDSPEDQVATMKDERSSGSNKSKSTMASKKIEEVHEDTAEPCADESITSKKSGASNKSNASKSTKAHNDDHLQSPGEDVENVGQSPVDGFVIDEVAAKSSQQSASSKKSSSSKKFQIAESPEELPVEETNMAASSSSKKFQVAESPQELPVEEPNMAASEPLAVDETKASQGSPDHISVAKSTESKRSKASRILTAMKSSGASVSSKKSKASVFSFSKRKTAASLGKPPMPPKAKESTTSSGKKSAAQKEIDESPVVPEETEQDRYTPKDIDPYCDDRHEDCHEGSLLTMNSTLTSTNDSTSRKEVEIIKDDNSSSSKLSKSSKIERSLPKKGKVEARDDAPQAPEASLTPKKSATPQPPVEGSKGIEKVSPGEDEEAWTRSSPVVGSGLKKDTDEEAWTRSSPVVNSGVLKDTGMTDTGILKDTGVLKDTGILKDNGVEDSKVELEKHAGICMENLEEMVTVADGELLTQAGVCMEIVGEMAQGADNETTKHAKICMETVESESPEAAKETYKQATFCLERVGHTLSMAAAYCSESCGNLLSTSCDDVVIKVDEMMGLVEEKGVKDNDGNRASDDTPALFSPTESNSMVHNLSTVIEASKEQERQESSD